MASFQEQYDSLIETLQEKGVPQPRIVVPAIAIVLLLALAYFFLLPSLAPSTVTVQFTLQSSDGQPLPNAAVTLYAGTKSFDSTSDGSGHVEFTDVPPGQKLQLRIKATGYSEETQTISYGSKSVQLQNPPAPSEIAFSAQVLTDQLVPIQDAQIQFTPDTGNPSTLTTDPLGEVKTTFSGVQSVTVAVTKEGYKTQSQDVSLSSKKEVQIILQKADATPTTAPVTGQTVVVSTSDSNNNPVSGVKVNLVDSYTHAVFSSATSDDTGQSRFDQVLATKTFTVSVTDPQKRYSDYASPSTLTPGPDPIAVTLLAAPPQGQLSITVKSNTGDVLPDTTVSFYNLHAGFIDTKTTDATGTVSLAIQDPTVFVTVYHDGYLPQSATLNNKDARSFTLQPSDGKTVHVNVTVQKNLEAAPQATVEIHTANGFPMGLPTQTTASDGTAYFDVPKSSTSIYAVASLPPSTGKSDLAVPQNDLVWVINLQPPDIPETVHVVDAVTQQPVNGAKVDFVTTEVKATCTTNAGTCQVNVPTETQFSIVVENPGYLPYQSVPQLLTADTSSSSYSVKLYPTALTQSATVQFQGFYADSGNALRETSNAQTLEARFLVSLPAATGSDTARFAVWLPADPSAPTAAIISVAGTSKFYTGTDVSSACNPSSSDNQSDANQFAVFEFPKGFSGTRQVSLDFLISPQAKPPSTFSIQYDLHGMHKSIPFVFPLDTDVLNKLLAQPSVSDADFCGQKFVTQTLPLSKDVLTCTDAYCSKAVFITQDGQRFVNTAQIPDGQNFGMDLALVGLQNGISQVQVSAPPEVQLISLQPVTASTPSQSNFDSLPSPSPDATSASVSQSVVAGKNQKVSLHLDAKAMRASSNVPITVTVTDTDGNPTSFVENLVINGNNVITATPSVSSLDATISQNLHVVVRDQFNKPVSDATVELYECDGSPLNGQTVQSTSSSGGTYNFQVQPSSIGTVGIRVTQTQFQPYESCALPVQSTDFLSADPQSLTLKGDTRKDTVTQTITLSSILDVKSTVTSVVTCTDSNGTSQDAPFTLSPQTQTLKSSATETLTANQQAFIGQCQITFTAKVNKDNIAAALVSVSVNLQGPPPLAQQCPTSQTGVRCLASSDPTAQQCTPNGLICNDPTMTCYQCNIGPQTLPSQITLSVSNYQSDATQTFAIGLDNNPDECRVEGFTNNPNYSPYGYNNPYALNPYGSQLGYAAPNSYYAYQQNPYTPYSTNPFNTAGSCFPGTPGYASGYPGIPTSGYAQGYGGVAPLGGVYPSYPYGTGGVLPNGVYGTSVNAANPATASANCQTIISKLSAQCQVYFTQYNPYNANQQYYGNLYRDPWANNLNPNYPSTTSLQYPQQRPVVNVQADCSKSSITVTAQYTGGDTSYGGALGGNQQGYLLVRMGGQTKQIPITVLVQTPTTPIPSVYGAGTYPGCGGYPGAYSGGYAGAYAGGYSGAYSGAYSGSSGGYPSAYSGASCYPSSIPFPSGFPSNQIPPQCLLEYQQAVLTTTTATTQEAGLDSTGLPDSLDVYYNKYTGEGIYERELKPPVGGTLKLEKPSNSQVKMDVTGNTLRVTVKCTKKDTNGNYDCPSDVPFKATWTFTNLPGTLKDRTIRISQDDFQPAVIQLLVASNPKDETLFDVTTTATADFSKAKCKEITQAKCRPGDGTILGSATASLTNDARLEISGMGDYQIRRIPVRVSSLENKILLDPGKETKKTFTPKLTVKPTCIVPDSLNSLIETPTCTLDSITVKAKSKVGAKAVTDWINFTFDDSGRKSDFRPFVQVTVSGQGAGPDSTWVLKPVGTVTAGSPFVLQYRFPVGDDADSRLIVMTFTSKANGAKTDSKTFKASDLAYSGTDGSTVRIPAEPEGTWHVVATGKLLKDGPLKKEADITVSPVNSKTAIPARAPATAPGPGQAPRPGTPGKPGKGVPPQGKATCDNGVLKDLSVYRLKSGNGELKDSIVIRSPSTSSKADGLSAFYLVIKGDKKGDFRSGFAANKWEFVGSGTYRFIVAKSNDKINFKNISDLFADDSGNTKLTVVLTASKKKQNNEGTLQSTDGKCTQILTKEQFGGTSSGPGAGPGAVPGTPPAGGPLQDASLVDSNNNPQKNLGISYNNANPVLNSKLYLKVDPKLKNFAVVVTVKYLEDIKQGVKIIVPADTTAIAFVVDASSLEGDRGQYFIKKSDLAKIVNGMQNTGWLGNGRPVVTGSSTAYYISVFLEDQSSRPIGSPLDGKTNNGLKFHVDTVTAARPPTESVFYDMGNQNYDVLLVKTDWSNYPRAGPIHIGGIRNPGGTWNGGNDYYLTLRNVMDPGWGGVAAKWAAGATAVIVPIAAVNSWNPFGWGAWLTAGVTAGSAAAFAALSQSGYISVELADNSGSRWNCGHLIQWGNEAHLTEGEAIVCSTWNPFGTSANVKIQERQMYATTKTYNTIQGYQSGWAEVIVSPGS